jgi:hypothetical protein
MKGIKIRLTCGQMAFICAGVSLYVGSILAAGTYVAILRSPMFRP